MVRLFEKSFAADGWKVYPCSKGGFGACLIENRVDGLFYVITGSDSESSPLSLKRVKRVRDSFSVYKGKKIDVVVFIGRLFSEKAKKAAKDEVIGKTVLLELGPFETHTATQIFASSALKGDFLVLKLEEFILELYEDLQVVKFSTTKPKTVSLEDSVDAIRILAFSDWRVQEIDSIYKLVESIEPVDFIVYAGDDIGRFEEKGINYFSKLSGSAKSGQVLAVIGNDDTYLQKRILKAKGVHDLYKQSYVYKNFAFIGLEASTSGPALFRHEEKDFEEHLRYQLKQVNRRRLVVLSHTPPYGILDRGIRFADLDENTHHIGSTALRSFIDTKPVDLVICGHCHSHGGMIERCGNTTIVNVSSHDNPGSKGNFAVIESTKDGTVNVEWHDTFEIGGRDSLMRIYGIGPVRAKMLTRCGISKIDQIAECEDLVELSRKSSLSENHLKVLQLRAKSLLNNKTYQIARFVIDCDNAIFFDIETDIACERVWLIGFQIDGRFTRFYADNWIQEKEILERFTEILRDNPNRTLVSFSGTNFDYRVTLEAIRRYKLEESFLTLLPHIDLSTLIRRSFILPNQRFALKDLAAFLGYSFKYPDLDGFIVALRYHKHVEDGSPLDPKILEYNQDDVKALPFIIEKLKNEPRIEKTYSFDRTYVPSIGALSEEIITLVRESYERFGRISIRKDKRYNGINVDLRFYAKTLEELKSLRNAMATLLFNEGAPYQFPSHRRCYIPYYGKGQVIRFMNIVKPRTKNDISSLL